MPFHGALAGVRPMPLRRGLSLAVLAAAAFMLSGCELWDSLDLFGGSSGNKRPLEGARVPVLPEERVVEADERIAGLTVALPDPVPNADWPQPGGNPTHNMQHLAASGLAVQWRSNIGTGSSDNGFLSASPIVAGGQVYAVDARAVVSAYDAQTGRRMWRFDTEPEEARTRGAGGGVAFEGGRLYVTTGYAQVLALDASNAHEDWRVTVTAPVRAAPTLAGGRVFAVSADNQVHAFDAASGRRLWGYAGSSEGAGFYGNASPAVEGNVLVAVFSSGEIYGLRVESGRVVWQDALTGLLRTDAISALADIRGLPVIDQGTVTVISNGGRMASLELRTGGHLWDRDVASRVHPWLAGDFLFVTSADAQLVAMTRRDGRVRWVRQLAQFRDEEHHRGPIDWTGPVVAGGRVVLANSNREIVAFDPANGNPTATTRLPGGVRLSPVVANGTIYVLTEDGDLVALR
jgi:outer membrane protein assembly factor BamB